MEKCFIIPENCPLTDGINIGFPTEDGKMIILQDYWKEVISPKTLMEHFGVDYDEEVRRLAGEKEPEESKVQDVWDLL